MTNASASVAELCRDHGLSIEDLSAKSGVDSLRVTAIVMGRWTPSPQERQKIAAVFNVAIDNIRWGHVTPIQHIYGHGPT